jgi:hypothetical protein
MNLPASLLACLGQRLAEVLSVHVIEEDAFAAGPFNWSIGVPNYATASCPGVRSVRLPNL